MRRGLVAVGVAGALAGGARAAAGPDVDVSRARGVQAEVSVAVDPVAHSTLVAASNSVVLPLTLRRSGVLVYSSTDAGATWRRSRGPRPAGTCVVGDPVVGIDRRRRQYLAYMAISPCRGFGVRTRLRVFVSSRGGPFGAWHTSSRSIAPVAASVLAVDDKPALVVDAAAGAAHPGRVYVAWSRGSRASADGDEPDFRIMMTWSDDGGRRWVRPVAVNQPGRVGIFATLALGARGEVYAAWQSRRGLEVAYARNGRTFGPARLAARAPRPLSLHAKGWCPRAQRRRCVTLSPSLVSTADHALVLTWAVRVHGMRRVFAARFDRALRPIRGPRQVAPTAAPSDQLLPAATADATTGTLWVCFYDTAPAHSRNRAVYSCVASRDGGATWSKRMPAASVPSDESAPAAFSFEYGDYEGVAAADGVAVPVWTDGRLDATRREEIFATRLYESDLPPTSSS